MSPPKTSGFSKQSGPADQNCVNCDPGKSGDALADQFAQCSPSGNTLVVIGPDPHDAKFKQAGMSLNNPPGPFSPFTVVIHGDPCGYKIYCQGEPRYISAQKLADLIKKCRGSQKGDVVTIGCRTANQCNDKNSPNYSKIPAQELAKALGDGVIAPWNSYGMFTHDLFGNYTLSTVQDFGGGAGHMISGLSSNITNATGGLIQPFPGSLQYFSGDGTAGPTMFQGGTQF